MTTQFHKTEAEYEMQVRNFLRLVSVCTLGLWSPVHRRVSATSEPGSPAVTAMRRMVRS